MNPDNKFIECTLTQWLLRKTNPVGCRHVAQVYAAVGSDIGLVRKENQDRTVIVRFGDGKGRMHVLAVLADGMGGLKDGAQAAALTIGQFIESFVSETQRGATLSNALSMAACTADKAVYTTFHGKSGSTLSAVAIEHGSNAAWLNVGDSRVYGLFEGSLRQLSVDDTIAGQLGMSVDDNVHSTNLLQFIGIGKELEPHIGVLAAPGTEAVILMSDGIHYLSRESEILSGLVRNASDAAICARRLMDLAKWCGGADNASVVILRLDQMPADNLQLPFFCIEVWDAHGELHLISVPRNVGLSKTQAGWPGAETTLRPNSPAVEESVVGQMRKKGKRKTRTEKVGEKEERRESNDNRSADDVQIRIEFSGKQQEPA